MRGHAGSLSGAQPQPVLEAPSRQERPFLPRLLLLCPESMQTTCTQTEPRCASRVGTGVRGLDSLAGVRRTPALPGGGTGRMQASAPGWALRAPGVRCRDLQPRQTGLNPQRPATLRKEARAPAPPRGAAVGAGRDLQVAVFTTGCPGGSGASVGAARRNGAITPGDRVGEVCPQRPLHPRGLLPPPPVPVPGSASFQLQLSAPRPPAALL